MFVFGESLEGVHTREAVGAPQASAPATSPNLATHARAALMTAINIIGHHCRLDKEGLHLRVAPIEFAEIGPVMQTRAMFVLQRGGLYGSELEFVWVPLALAIHRAIGSPAQQARLRALVDFDIYITVNTNVHFVGGSSNCSWAGAPGVSNAYSITSVMLHEFLHGMGVYSLIQEHQTGAFRGHASVFDAQITRADRGGKLFTTQAAVQNTNGEMVAGQAFYVAGNMIYNPSPFVTGSSLSHFSNSSSIMHAHAAAGECNFEIGQAEIATLKSIGWNCSLSSDQHTWASGLHGHPPSGVALVAAGVPHCTVWGCPGHIIIFVIIGVMLCCMLCCE